MEFEKYLPPSQGLSTEEQQNINLTTIEKLECENAESIYDDEILSRPQIIVCIRGNRKRLRI